MPRKLPERSHLSSAGGSSLRALLPGEAEEKRQLVDNAVVELNQLYRQQALQTARLVGGYLLEHFFDGSLSSFRQAAGHHASFRALARHPELHFSATSLWTAIRIVEQLSELPDEIGEHLSLAQHRLLLSVKDENAKRALAERAVANSLSKRELESEIQRCRSTPSHGPRVGRPRLPPVIKGLSQLKRQAREILAMSRPDTELADYPPDRALELLECLEHDLESISRLLEVVRGRIFRAAPRR